MERKQKFVAAHPIVGLISAGIAILLWTSGGGPIGWIMTVYWCATAFTYWTLLILVNQFLRVPLFFFAVGAVLMAFLGSWTLITYRPAFDIPTIVHLMEAFIGYSFFVQLLVRKTSR